MRFRRLAATTTAAALVATSAWCAAPAAAASNTELVDAIFSREAAALVTSSGLVTPNGGASAVRTAQVAGFPSRAGGSYAILSTGQASALDQYSSLYEATTRWSSSTTRGSAYDVTTLSVTLDVPATANCLLGVTFRFLTEEFPDFTGGTYNDAFIAEVGESTWRIEGTTIVAPNNFAFDMSGRVISVNSGLFDSGTAAAEASGTVFGGATPKLTAQVPLTPGARQTLHFSVFDQGDGDLDSAVLIDNLRIGTVGNPATQCVAGATTNPLETLVSAVAPTKTDVSGTTGDTYTIPSTTGVIYSVGGSPVAAGTYPGTGTVVVTASPAPGYALSGVSQFTLTFSSVSDVTAVEPTWNDSWGTADDTYTIPAVTGVQYSVDGAPVTPGTYPASGTVVVTATAASADYRLTGTTQFDRTFTDIRQVAAAAPMQADPYGTADDTFTIPSVPGVEYSVDGKVITPGTYPGTGTVVLTASATAGYELTGPSQFTLVFTNVLLVAATAPTWHDADGTSVDTFTIPSITGVVYTVGGSPVAPGTYPASGTVTVVATAASGYALTGTTTFSRTFTDITNVTAVAPTVFDEPGTSRDRVTIPKVPGVAYLLGGAPVSAGTHTLTGDHVVSALAADARHVLVGTTSFPIHLSDADVPARPVVTAQPTRGAVELTWTNPSGEPTGYEVQSSSDGTTWRSAGSTTRAFTTVDGLTGGRTYEFRVRAVNDLGRGAWSESVSATPVAPPGAPAITKVVEGNRRLAVTLKAPKSDGGSPVERYEYSLDEGLTWTTVDGTSFAITGLVNGTAYPVQVRAVSAVGAGTASETASGTPAARPVVVPDDEGGTARPRLAPGESGAWVDGERTSVTTGVDHRRVTISGPGFDVYLTGMAPNGTRVAPGADGRITVEPGGYVSVSGAGFAPGEVVDVWLFSTPVLLGTVKVDADGAFGARLALPEGVPTGEHTLQINGTRADGSLVSVATGLEIREAVGTLPVTGAQIGSAGLVAVWLLVAGGLAVLVSRRRRHA